MAHKYYTADYLTPEGEKMVYPCWATGVGSRSGERAGNPDAREFGTLPIV